MPLGGRTASRWTSIGRDDGRSASSRAIVGSVYNKATNTAANSSCCKNTQGNTCGSAQVHGAVQYVRWGAE